MEKYEKQIKAFLLGFLLGGIFGIIILDLVIKGII